MNTALNIDIQYLFVNASIQQVSNNEISPNAIQDNLRKIKINYYPSLGLHSSGVFVRETIS